MVGLDTMDIGVELALVDTELEREALQDLIDGPKLSLYDKILNSLF